MAYGHTVKAWVHDGTRRFEKWLNPLTGLFENQPPEVGFTQQQAQDQRETLRCLLPKSTKLFLVVLVAPIPVPQLALARPSAPPSILLHHRSGRRAA